MKPNFQIFKDIKHDGKEVPKKVSKKLPEIKDVSFYKLEWDVFSVVSL